MSQILYFNGVNGDTGRYGLPGMTAQALADHVLDAVSAEAKALRELENRLKQTARNKQKILGIVELLAGRAWGEQSASADAELAQRAAHILLDARATPGHVKALERYIAADPVAAWVSIVQWLAENRGQELAALLLSVEPDNRAALKEKLKQETLNRIAEVRRALQGAPAEACASAHCARALREAPLDSLEFLTETRNIVQRARDLLLARLSSIPCLAPLMEELDRLRVPFSWGDLVETLCAGLERGQCAADPTAYVTVRVALQGWLDALAGQISTLGVVEGVDPNDLAQAGWGIIFPARMDTARRAAIERALEPLLRLRRQQAGPYYRLYAGSEGYRPGDSAATFLERPPRGARASDPADPQKAPYYLLLIGSPEEIPFEFQYQLDVQYAVGRLDFSTAEGEDDVEAYAHYAANVVTRETQEAAGRAASRTAGREQKVVFFAVQNPGDAATELSYHRLARPLCERLRRREFAASWQFELTPPDEARKADLLARLQAAPAILFTTGHGVEFGPGDPDRQRRFQGALLCGDWDGQPGTISPDWFLAGEDIRRAEQLDMAGGIAFFFACYGAGTPLYDEYYRQEFKESGRALTGRPFVADLPKALLGRAGGALAVVGHIERVWGASFLGAQPESGAGSVAHVAVFESALARLLKGHPLGSAMEYFNMRYAALATELTALLDAPSDPNPYALAEKWTASNDARGYIVLGDPAVRVGG